MALTVGPLLTAVRDRHPAFHKSRVPDGVLARRLTHYQRQLITALADIDSSLVVQQASIIFSMLAENAVGVVGVNTAGGLPGSLVGQVPGIVEEPAGSLIEEDRANATELVAPTLLTAATANTLTKAAAGWGVDAYAGKLVEITDGPGARQVREIQSNTATVLTLKAGSTFEIIPTVESRFRIIAVLLQLTKQMGVVTGPALPTSIRQAYLVRINAAGAAYIDYGKPLIARFDDGIALPPFETVVGGTVHYAGETGVGNLEIRPYRYRMSKGERHTSWLENGSLFLGGDSAQWKDIDSIDLRYIPIAPDITALTDVLLVPDVCSPALIAQLSLCAGERINGLPDVPKIDLQALATAATNAEQLLLSGVGRQSRQVESFVQDVWP